jgi:superfamily I DNA/RNA helicase/RecB family exonuclease
MTTYRLASAAPPAAAAPALDERQRAVVEHAAGPLLVLAGPGTGKTTTMVEAIVDRVERRDTDPSSILALTFSRKAAEQLRDRVSARLGQTTTGSLAATFHSFAYGLVRRYAPPELYAAPLRLLSAPEQDVVLQELLSTAPEAVRWPAQLRDAVGTRGFAREVQSVIARARERGLDPDELRDLGRAEGLPELEAAGLFLGQYLDVLGAQSAIDYPDLIARAVIEAARHREELRAAYSCVFVDEYQDSDPSQVALLQELAGGGRDLVVVGDPDQSIYGFRGADVRGILDFPAAFPTREGTPAPVVALGVARRFGPVLLQASRNVARSIPIAGSIPAGAYDAFRQPVAAEGDPGSVEVLTFDTPRAEVEHIADLLRRAHLEQGVPWSRMAVLVRSGREMIPSLRRALAGAGVPVDVATDETPLTREPAARLLLDALTVAVSGEGAGELLTTPLGGLDASDVRALVRRLRSEEPELSAPDAVRRAADDPALSELGVRLAAARAVLAEGGSAEEALWALWDGSEWSRRLRASVELGGAPARMAHRDLDAVVALFEAAAKAEEQRANTSVAEFLAQLTAQEIPGDTLAERGIRGETVRLLTAHRAKGLEWDLVVVAHAQEESWPDLRRRDSLLGADRIGPREAGGLLPPLSRGAMLAEERRLFYVAVTRARSRLVVTAVRSAEEDGEQPSRFLDELAPVDAEGAAARHRVGRPARSLSLPSLVAELRRTLADAAQPMELRQAAGVRLRRLAEVVPAARPDHWWGMRDLSDSEAPVRPAEQPIRLSASALEAILTCPAKWFLEREAGGSRPSTTSQGFGIIAHALAERVASGELEHATIEELMELVDQVWDRMEFRIPWSRERDRAEIRDVLERFLAWHRSPSARPVLRQEADFDLTTEVGGVPVRLAGTMDRLEKAEDGAVVVVDLKTGKYPPPDKDLPANPQLGLYQLVVDRGGVAEWTGAAHSGGAELIQLRKPARKGSDQPKVQRQEPARPGEPLAVEQQLVAAAGAVREELFVARPGDHCRLCSFTAVCPAETSGSVLT